MPTNAAMIAANADRWAKAHIHPQWQKAIDETADRLTAPGNKAKFLAVQQAEGVKWFAVAIIKERESGADPAFKRSIAQGDPWNARSVHVPKGRGPFMSWEAAAHDALIDCAPFAGRWRDWSIGGLLTILEKYNGVGYASRGLPSPYIWSKTNIYIKGKYVRDGVFDPEYVDQQIGCAALLLAMQKRDPSITFDKPGTPARPTAEPPKAIVDAATKNARQVRTGATVGGAAAGGAEASKTGTQVPAATLLVPSFVTYSLIGVAVAIAIAATIIVARRKAAIFNIW
jgi:lysozyme family protein